MSFFRQVQFDPSNQSAFGTLETNELTPLIQGDFVYGLNTQIWNTPTVSGTGATVDTNSSRARIQSGTSSSSYAYLTSRRIAKYRAGQGMLFRMTPIFTAGVANNTQLWGVGSIVSNAPYDGYFFGFNGITFSIAHYIAGSPTWTAQTSWNGDKVDGTAGTSFTWDKTKGIPVMIKYPYLGYGNIFFYVQHPTTSRWILVHTIQYANTTAVVQLTNPNLRIIGFTANSGNTSNMTMYAGSVGLFISGTRNFISNPRWSATNTKTGVTAETNILSIRSATTYNTVTNNSIIRLSSLSVGVDSGSVTTGSVLFRIGATGGGSPAFVPISGATANNGVTITSGNSIASVDTAGTTATGGSLIFTVGLVTQKQLFIDLMPFELFIAPTETLTISGTSSSNTSFVVGINWSEDI